MHPVLHITTWFLSIAIFLGLSVFLTSGITTARLDACVVTAEDSASEQIQQDGLFGGLLGGKCPIRFVSTDLSLPQELGITSTPTFSGVTLSSLETGQPQTIGVDEQGRLVAHEPFINTDEQTLTLVNRKLSISRGNTIDLPNGLQELALADRRLAILGGNEVELPNDIQELSLDGMDLAVSGSNKITFPKSSGSQTGWLSSDDYKTFAAKQPALTFSSDFLQSGTTVSLALTFGAGLERTGNALTNTLSTGLGTTQTIFGGLDAGGSLTLQSTAAATKGNILLNPDGGNVGIGTTSPEGLLELSGSIGVAQLWTRSSDDGTSAYARFRKSRAGLVVQNNDELGWMDFLGHDGNSYKRAALILSQVDGEPGVGDMPGRLTFWTTPDGSSTAQERLRITSSGNVGIGTTAPVQKLHVFGGTGEHAQVRVQRSDNTKQATFALIPAGTFSPSNVQWNMGLHANTNTFQLSVYDGSTTVYPFNVLNTGNVGIGVTNPAYKLDVAGDINTTGDIRKNGTLYNNPDYVFEPDYDLMSISDLKTYVAENKHLPNVPSSEDVKRDGVKLFEQTRLNLEKTEEAYLYIFDLDDRVSSLSLSLAPLTTDLSALKTQVSSQTLTVSATSGFQGYQPDEESIRKLAAVLEGIELDATTGAWEVRQEVHFWEKLVSNAQTLFKKAVTFMAEAIFEKPVQFLARVTFGKRPVYEDRDIAGIATIKQGRQDVRIVFDEVVNAEPIVQVTPVDHDASFFVTDVSIGGFTISLTAPADRDIRFNWFVVNVKDPNTFESKTSPRPDKPDETAEAKTSESKSDSETEDDAEGLADDRKDSPDWEGFIIDDSREFGSTGDHDGTNDSSDDLDTIAETEEETEIPSPERQP